ncbi:hypothetical protein C8R45DRAFT_1217574 [Mycena sanguinolenta]|nr:hypothetical protein C8R45DRAFT_1217574 [Mycena sanguinolenta]
MANFTTALLGSFSRMFFPSTTLPSSQSDLDLTAERAAARACIRSASSASVRPRPRSAFDGYWRWEESGGMILLDRTLQDPGLKGLSDIQITRSSPVFACQPPPRADVSNTMSEEFDSVNALQSSNSSVAIPDSSFDISLISDISTSDDAEDSFESDTSFTVPPPPAVPASIGLGLGLSGLFKADGSPFDGMGVVSFGCDKEGNGGSPRATKRSAGGLSRVFLEEAAWTWAADPDHQMLTVIQENEEQELAEENAEHVKPRTVSHKSKSSKTNVTRPLALLRDLSTMDTVSSGLKRRTHVASPISRSPPAPLGARRASSVPAWRG